MANDHWTPFDLEVRTDEVTPGLGFVGLDAVREFLDITFWV